MPYTSTPPVLWNASKIVTAWPRVTSSPAHVRPAGPLPTTATRQPDGSGAAGSGQRPCARFQSATNRSRLPMATGSPFRPTTHLTSHCVSCGHTRPQTAGRALTSRMRSAASSNLPSATSFTNPGMSMPTGHPAMHRGFLHRRHRAASACACSGV